MGKKLWLDQGGNARVERREDRVPEQHPRARVHQAWRYIQGAVRHSTDSDDAIVARAKVILGG